jgi:hypothetical protein
VTTTARDKKKENDWLGIYAAAQSCMLQYQSLSEIVKPDKKLPITTWQRIRENIMMALTSIITKFYGRWALLNIVSYANFASYLLSNFLYIIPEIIVLGTIARGFFEACAIIHEARTQENISKVSAISLLTWRQAKTLNELEYINTVNTQLFTKEKAKQCVKSGSKLATVYTAWSIAVYTLKVVLALTVMAACWQAVVVIVGAAIVTGLSLAAINYCVDRRENCVQDGAAQGTAEGVAWSALENAELHESAAIGSWGDCAIVALGVSFIYGVSGAINNWNKRITFSESEVTSRFNSWGTKRVNQKNITNELKQLLEEKGYNTYRHWLTGSYNYAMRTAMKTVKLHLLEKYANNPSHENKRNAGAASKIHRHLFSWGTSSSQTLFKKIKSGNNRATYSRKLQKSIKQQTLNYASQ